MELSETNETVVTTETPEEEVVVTETPETTETKKTDSEVTVEDDLITLTKKQLQAKLDSTTDKKINKVVSKKNEEIDNLKLKIQEYEALSAEDFKQKIQTESKQELESKIQELNENLKNREEELNNREAELVNLENEFNRKLNIQLTKKLLYNKGLNLDIAEELTLKYGDDLEKIENRILELKASYDEQNLQDLKKNLSIKTPKISKQEVDVRNNSNLSIQELIKNLRKK